MVKLLVPLMGVLILLVFSCSSPPEVNNNLVIQEIEKNVTVK